MRRRTIVFLFSLVILAMVVAWGVSRKAAPPEVPFARTKRERIVSVIPTNGKVEPAEWATARAERAGVVTNIYIHRGQDVRQGAELVSLDTREAAANLAGAAARVREAQAQQQVVQQGGRAAEVTEIENALAKAGLDLQTAQRDDDAVKRLAAKQASTKQDVLDADAKVKQLQLQIQSLQRRRAALVSAQDQSAAQARVQEAESSEAAAQANVAMSTIRAPISGNVYQFDLRRGTFLQAGDLVANIGVLDRVRVTVYVDEPDLGRVAVGETVTITWTAMPARKWKGVVDRMPTEVVPLGTRQVGEVGCVIENPDRDLLPGTNVDVEIQSKAVENALTIPREALLRQADQTGVFVLAPGNTVAWKPVQIGVATTTRAEAKDGLSDSDSIALPTDKPLKTGMEVTPVYP
jgi:HlyD family secretion protein